MKTTGISRTVIWKTMWHAFEKQRRSESVSLTVNPGYSGSTAVFDRVRQRTEANLNTHRVVFLAQSENGAITESDLIERLSGEKKITVSGELRTADRAPGLALGTVQHGPFAYDIVFTDLPFYTSQTLQMFETGGIVTGPVVVTDHQRLEADLLCAAGVRVEAGATLEVIEPATLVFSEAVVLGSLKGYLTGVLRVAERGEVNGNLIAGEVVLSGTPTLIGMYYGETITIADDSVVLWKEFGSMTNAMDVGKNVTLRFQDAEPLVLTMDPDNWRVNGGNENGPAGFVGTNTTGNSWFLSYTSAPVDLLGRRWAPDLGGGVPMPEMTNIGVMKHEKDLALEVVDDTEHNFALFMMNQHPITRISGAIHIHAIEGVACPPEDVEALEVSDVRGEGTASSPYTLEYGLRDPGYTFSSAESIAVQASTKAVVMERFPDIDQFGWQFAPNREGGGYSWYAYPKGAAQEHWDGPTGDEVYTVVARPTASAHRQA